MGETPFTTDELRHYQDHGYVLKRRFFPERELEPFVKRFLAIVNEAVPPAPGMTLMRDVMVAKGAVKPATRAAAIAKIQDFQNDPVLYDGYVKHPRLLDAAEHFTGPDIKAIHNMLINKPPGVDGRHPFTRICSTFPFVRRTRLWALGRRSSRARVRMAASWWCPARTAGSFCRTRIRTGRG